MLYPAELRARRTIYSKAACAAVGRRTLHGMIDDFLRVKHAPEMRTYPMRLELAGYYSDDAHDFFQRYRLTFYSDQMDFQGVKSRRIKAYVDLRMALEALLKAVICLRARRGLAGKRLVRMVRNYSHDIGRLKRDALRGVSLDTRYSEAIDGCRTARIDLRYQFDAMIFREPDDGPYHETIGSDVWLRTLEELVETGLTRLRASLNRRTKIVPGQLVRQEIKHRPSDYPKWPEPS